MNRRVAFRGKTEEVLYAVLKSMRSEILKETRNMNSRVRNLTLAFLAVASAFGADDVRGDDHVTGVPQLSSRPGATYTIYLDFAGFDFGGTWLSSTGAMWGNRPAFDGNFTGSFTPAE